MTTFQAHWGRRKVQMRAHEDGKFLASKSNIAEHGAAALLVDSEE